MQERIGCHAGELPEILDEVRLVEVSAVGGQVGPLNRIHTWIFRLLGLDIRFADGLVRLASRLAGRASARRD